VQLGATAYYYELADKLDSQGIQIQFLAEARDFSV
jgi:hypothetical protein